MTTNNVYQIVKRTGKRSTTLVGTYTDRSFAEALAATITGFEDTPAEVREVEVHSFTSMEEYNNWLNQRDRIAREEIVAKTIAAMEPAVAAAFRQMLANTQATTVTTETYNVETEPAVAEILVAATDANTANAPAVDSSGRPEAPPNW